MEEAGDADEIMKNEESESVSAVSEGRSVEKCKYTGAVQTLVLGSRRRRLAFR